MTIFKNLLKVLGIIIFLIAAPLAFAMAIYAPTFYVASEIGKEIDKNEKK